MAALPDELLRLVDVGGAGGLPDAWLPHAARLLPVLFEPNPDQAAALREAARAAYPHALVVESALAHEVGPRPLNVARYWGCTSLREPDMDLLSRYRIGPLFETVNRVAVACTRYDALHAAGRVPAPDVIRADVQGFEHEVLQGFGGLLQSCLAVEVEAHLRPIYRGQKLLHDVVALLAGYGFVLRALRPVGSFDGDVVEVDAFFTKDRPAWLAMDAAARAKLALVSEVWGLVDYARVDWSLHHNHFA